MINNVFPWRRVEAHIKGVPAKDAVGRHGLVLMALLAADAGDFSAQFA